MESGAEDQVGEVAARDLLSRLATACGVVGKGTVRVLVVPVQLLSPAKPEGVSELEVEEASAEPQGESPKKPWLPNTMVEGELTSAADVAYEIDRLRAKAATGATSRRGAPSPVLVSMLEASHKAAEEIGKAPVSTTSSPGNLLGRGLPWIPSGSRPVESSSALTTDGAAKPPFRKSEKAGEPRRSSQPQSAPQPVTRLEPDSVPNDPPHSDYVAVVLRGPFHVFDESPDQSILIELEGERVGRVRDQGKEWVWLQLDSGLMGVMRHKYLRDATPEEVQQFLAMEALPQANRAVEEFAIGVIDLDGSGIPIQSEAGKADGERKAIGTSLPIVRERAKSPSAVKEMKPSE